MKIRQLQRRTKSRTVVCRPTDGIRKIAALLAEERIGAVPVVSDGRVVGILSERDICGAVATHADGIASLTAADLMTRDVVVCRLDDTVKQAMRLMSSRHVRHLPVVDDLGLVGMVSLRDVLQATLDETKLEANVLRDCARAHDAVHLHS